MLRSANHFSLDPSSTAQWPLLHPQTLRLQEGVISAHQRDDVPRHTQGSVDYYNVYTGTHHVLPHSDWRGAVNRALCEVYPLFLNLVSKLNHLSTGKNNMY